MHKIPQNVILNEAKRNEESLDFKEYLASFIFNENSEGDLFISNEKKTRVETNKIDGEEYSQFINEFWTSKQRQASSLHEIAYRACFKPQLPRFFIETLSQKGDVIYDPFSGRGTTVLEAGLLDRNVISNDVNPLSRILTYPRFFVPDILAIENRLNEIPFQEETTANFDLSMFYHPKTENELISLRNYFCEKNKNQQEDLPDAWIRMVATNRLTGHSPGFFSVYTLPPNQAVNAQNQKKINEKRKQKPEYRNVKKLILKKTRTLLKGMTREIKVKLKNIGDQAVFLNTDARDTNEVRSGSVQLTVTSPPFLNVVQYANDNWLRSWFNDIEVEKVSKKITMARTVEDWNSVMGQVFSELFRITKPYGWVAFEVGEVNKGKIKLDEHIVPIGVAAGFNCEGILVNRQNFTKTANIWGIDNNSKGTNSNRVVLFQKQ